MKKSFWLLVFLLAFTSLTKAQNTSQKWYAAFELNGEELPLVLEVSDNGKEVKMFSPRQSEKGFEVQDWRCNAQEMNWQIKALKIEYRGVWESADSTYNGQFTQGGMKIPLAWSKKAKAPAAPKFNRPQTPKGPLGAVEKELSFISMEGEKEIALSGTLVLPEGSGPFPCLIMISGSGPQDRNEEILGHQPFAIIAEALAKKGWASFRYDDRGVGKSKGNFSNATTLDFAADAHAAWRALQSEKSLNGDRIGLLGHSEGGLVAPIVAAENPGVYCIVSLAGPGVNGAEILITQTADIDRAEGMKEDEITKAVNDTRVYVDWLQQGLDSIQVAKNIKKYVNKTKKKMSKEVRESIFITYNQSMNTKWMKTFVKIEPIPYWQKVQCSTLVLNGDKDWQVRWDMNANKIAETLLKNNVPFEKVILADHNHLFQYSESGKVSEYAKIEETISPETLQSITDWLSKLP